MLQFVTVHAKKGGFRGAGQKGAARGQTDEVLLFPHKHTNKQSEKCH